MRETAVWAGWAAKGLRGLIVGFFVFVTWGMPSTDDLWEARQGQSITFLDHPAATSSARRRARRPPVELASLPPFVAQAFIAIEDKRFLQWGVDTGVMRASAKTCARARGANSSPSPSNWPEPLSTNDAPSGARRRKWRWRFGSAALQQDEILALYLNRVYFGAGAYGVEAALRYFDHRA